jgi:putative restriction endonuclease
MVARDGIEPPTSAFSGRNQGVCYNATVNDAIAQELEHRLKLWQRLLDTGGVQRVKPQRLRELGVYGGAQGIWVDKARTRQLTPDGTGVSVGLLHTGTAYSDDLSHDGVLYHYPKTGRPAGRDRAEINSTKAAGRLGLPVYVVTPGPVSADRSVHLAWVEDWDDRSRLFLISFCGSRRQPP